MITVKSQPIIKLGVIEVGAGGSALVLLIILIGGFGAGYWYFRERQRMLHIDVAMTSRDQSHLYTSLNDDLEKLMKNFDGIHEDEKKFILGRIHENVQKMEKYIVEEIKNIGSGK